MENETDVDMMEADQYIDLIGKYLSGNIEPDERTMLLSWVAETEENKHFFDEMTSLWGISAQYPETLEVDVAAAWKKVDMQLVDSLPEKPAAGKVVPLRSRRWLLQIAAAGIILLGFGWWLWISNTNNSPLIAAETGLGENKTIELPDGSTIWLNQNSRITYQEKFFPRSLSLEGEAFFDVSKQPENPFTIQTGDVVTTVLGTSFNVRAYTTETKVEVSVKTGKVQLKEASKPENAVALEKGNSGVFIKETKEIIKDHKEILNADAWKTQTLKFAEAPMSEVISSLERYYGIEIKTDNSDIDKCPLSIDQLVNPDLDIVIKMIEFSMSLEFKKITTNRYELTGKGC